MSLKHWYIKTSRYLLGRKFLAIMDGPLKGYQWTTARDYAYLEGDYEDPEVMDSFLRWCKPDAVFYDIGANVGYYSLIANRFIKDGVIYSLEPLPRNRIIFEKHLALNKNRMPHNNIHILPYAVSDREKEVVFSDNPLQPDGNTYIDSADVFRNAANNLTLPAFSIDSLLEKGYEKPDIIKIDVEGAEYDVLKGAVRTLKEYKPNILLATHDCQLPGVKDKCIQLLQELGYSLQYTGSHNKSLPGLEDYIAVYEGREGY